jgi:hypothetical protein
MEDDVTIRAKKPVAKKARKSSEDEEPTSKQEVSPQKPT